MGITGPRSTGYVSTVHSPKPETLAQATPSQNGYGSKPAPAKSPIGQGSGADIPPSTNVSIDPASQRSVSQLQAEIAGYEQQLLLETSLKKRAELQKNLGIAHIKLGNAYEERSNRAGKEEELKKALMAFDAALKMFKSNNASRAEIQKYRGIALIRLGGTEDLKKALTAFNEALKVFKSDNAKYAEVQDDIGIALESLAVSKVADARKNRDIKKLKTAKKLLEDSADAFNAAIDFGSNARGEAIKAKDDAKRNELNFSLQVFQGDLKNVQHLTNEIRFLIEKLEKQVKD
jgi:tetratricopeptide (TPR) repeat protein